MTWLLEKGVNKDDRTAMPKMDIVAVILINKADGLLG